VSDRRQHQPFGRSFAGLIGSGRRGSGLLRDVKSWTSWRSSPPRSCRASASAGATAAS